MKTIILNHARIKKNEFIAYKFVFKNILVLVYVQGVADPTVELWTAVIQSLKDTFEIVFKIHYKYF